MRFRTMPQPPPRMMRDGDHVDYRRVPMGVNDERGVRSFLDAPQGECKNAPVALGL